MPTRMLAWLDTKDILYFLTACGLEKPTQAMRLLEELKAHAALWSMSALGRDRPTKIIPLLLKAGGGTSNPLQVLNRLFDLIKSIR